MIRRWRVMLGVLLTGSAGACGGKDSVAPFEPEISRIELAADTVALFPGQTENLNVSLFGPTGAPASGVSVTWSSSDTAVVRVSTSGQISGRHAGRAVVTVSAGSKSDQVVVRVGMTGRYVLSTANGQSVPATLDVRPNCASNGGSPAEYVVHSGYVQFSSTQADRAAIAIDVEEICRLLASRYYLGEFRAIYDVDNEVISWTPEQAGRTLFSLARIVGDSLVLKWKPDLGDSIQFKFIKQ